MMSLSFLQLEMVVPIEQLFVGKIFPVFCYAKLMQNSEKGKIKINKFHSRISIFCFLFNQLNCSISSILNDTGIIHVTQNIVHFH